MKLKNPPEMAGYYGGRGVTDWSELLSELCLLLFRR